MIFRLLKNWIYSEKSRGEFPIWIRWNYGSLEIKHVTSLKLLANVQGIPSPKHDIDGSKVRDVFYKDDALNRTVSYCESDRAGNLEIAPGRIA